MLVCISKSEKGEEKKSGEEKMGGKEEARKEKRRVERGQQQTNFDCKSTQHAEQFRVADDPVSRCFARILKCFWVLLCFSWIVRL